MNDTRRPLGQLLIEAGYCSEEQLRLALREQKKTGELLGDIMIRLGFAGEEQVSRTLARQSGVTFVKLRDRVLPGDLVSLVPEDVARRYKIIPVARDDAQLTVAMTDFLDIKAIDRLTRLTGLTINTIAATETDISAAIERLYRGSEAGMVTLQKELEGIEAGEVVEGEAGPVARLVDRLIAEGVRREATDVHIEPEEKVIRTRYRQDGILLPGPSLPKDLQSAIISRVKILAEMNIAETRLPQDGRIDFTLGKKQVDIRASTFPALFGESIVMRILDREQLVMGLPNLGLTDKTLEAYREVITRANGIILVTGPTGSGKTTTLYSTLQEINSLEKKIITLEDPIEYHFPMIQQAQINTRAGLTFARGLRAIFRQDPDIILVGEIRDRETVEMAVRSALTGHLVFSTIHTNDAASAISRLLDMEVEPYLLSSSVLAIVAQRLVRVLCSHCKRPVEPGESLGGKFTDLGIAPITMFERGGCDQCNQTGFKGRIGIFEILMMDRAVKQAVMDRRASDQIKDIAYQHGMVGMYEDGMRKVAGGVTTIEEVMRVTRE
ncbi:Flp pilus assembly complex ATPase component TadA [bacterium]|nr:Flp pilus assembly complex ATPase component TadA [candidate division CSSED10-310 bacterium]